MINADDFGLSEGVNRGILEAHRAGTVTSVSMLANAPGWADAVRRARAAGPGLGVGVHFNLTTGRPLTRARTLVDRRTGAFRPLALLVAFALAGWIDPVDVEAECAAQIARLREAGLEVTHADSHHHVHVLPGVAAPAIAAARRAGVAVVRVPLESRAPGAAPVTAVVVRAAVRASWRVASRGTAAATPGEARADHFYGLSLRRQARTFLRRLLAIVDALRPGTTEIMVHPGYEDATLAAWDGYTWQRERELAALTSPELRSRLRERDVELTRFGGTRP